MPWTDAQLEEIYPEPGGWMAVHYRQPMGNDCYFGPFPTKQAAMAFCAEHKLTASLTPLYLSVDWRR
jgi:hypothetical protein